MLMFIKYLAFAEIVMNLQEESMGEIVRCVEDMAEGNMVRTDKQIVFHTPLVIYGLLNMMVDLEHCSLG